MKKAILTAAILVAAIPGVWAQAAEAQTGASNYWSLSAGVLGGSDFDYDIPGGRVDVETDMGYGATVAYGRRFSDHWRGELNLSWARQDIDIVRRTGGPVILIFEDPGAVESYTLGANLYYDFITDGPYRPYVGGGLGIASLDVDDRVIRDSETAWKAQAVAGVAFPASDAMSWFVEGRYDAYFMDVEDGVGFSNAGSDLRTDSFGLFAGLRFGF